ncbi:DUF1328 domain-containing protein [Paraburkholderia silviterrae]|uniref:DUF1328 domain-containing protein n=1 Tax=Paraburkholderia silviterrae TaxID=2528715 RepID=A0A4R5M5R0_9BURK|nr:DUF1328 domain-containing protein [Paraburkholderia silviterrae]TDG21221.1 DUF1328 domain-containing protein [Paraburkholderia silviterrae]
MIYSIAFFLVAAVSAVYAFSGFAREAESFARAVFIVFVMLFALALDFRRRQR